MKCRSILVVEDDEAIREALKEVLQIEGYTHVATARNGFEALQMLELLDKPCLILLDLHMPHMDGFEFLHKIEGSSLKDVSHVVVVTAMSKPNIEGVRVIKKPIDLAHFLEEIAGFMSDDAKS